MPSTHFAKCLGVALLACAACSTTALAQAAPDATADSAQRLLQRVITVAKAGPVSRDTEASQVITALRTTKDPAVLPIFDKLRQTSSLENQVLGMVAGAMLAQKADGKGAARLDIAMLLDLKDPALGGSAFASLMDAKVMSVPQMQEALAKSTEPMHKAMVAGELNRMNELKDRAVLQELLKEKRDIVRYYAATTMLSNPQERDTGLTVMKEMSATHNLQNQQAEKLMLVRMESEKITAGVPWAAQIAADEKCDMELRYMAVSTLMGMKAPDGAAVLTEMLKKPRDLSEETKLGLLSIEYGEQLRPEALQVLSRSRSALVKSLAAIAQKSANRTDNTADILAVIKEGHPIVLDWALAYANRTPARSLTLRLAIVHQATIVDNIRDRDYERAGVAAESLLSDNGEEGRKAIANLLRSDNRAIVEATLAGIYRSDATGQSELVLPIWEGLTRPAPNGQNPTETSANYAAVILAREGRKESLTWLPLMAIGGTVQGPAFRALGSWYYIKLTGKHEAILRTVLAN